MITFPYIFPCSIKKALKSNLRAFLQSVGESNPCYQDENLAS